VSKIKILHAAFLSSQGIGIENQMIDENNLSINEKYEWTPRMFVSYDLTRTHSIFIKAKKKIGLFSNFKIVNTINNRIHILEYFTWLYFQFKNYDIIIHRYIPSSIIQFFFLKLFSNKIFLIHHTNEPEELKLYNGLNSLVNYYCEIYFGPKSIRMSKGIVAVTNEIGHFQISRSKLIDKKKYHLYPNGINLIRNNVLQKISDKKNNIPTFLFVSSIFYPWQGLDLLLDEFFNYSDDFILHVVGLVSDDLLIKYKHYDKFKFHGVLNQRDISYLAESSWVGISSLALFRQGLTEACALKVREYLLMGLPVIGTYKEVLPNNFPFYFKIEVNAKKIFDFAYNTRNCSKNFIREASIPHISKQKIMFDLCESLSEK
jgi:hypothetical protein